MLGFVNPEPPIINKDPLGIPGFRGFPQSLGRFIENRWGHMRIMDNQVETTIVEWGMY